jgi:hypothetical protein
MSWSDNFQFWIPAHPRQFHTLLSRTVYRPSPMSILPPLRPQRPSSLRPRKINPCQRGNVKRRVILHLPFKDTIRLIVILFIRKSGKHGRLLGLSCRRRPRQIVHGFTKKSRHFDSATNSTPKDSIVRMRVKVKVSKGCQNSLP